MKLFTTSDIRNLDKYTIEKEPVSSVELMERAAKKFVDEFISRFDKSRHVYVFAGYGNNGGDALTVARMLLSKSYEVHAFLCNPEKRLSSDCRINKDRLLEEPNMRFTEINSEFIPPPLTEQDVVIDGLFGSGLDKPLTGGFAGLARYINASPASVVAVDIPSGLFGEDTGIPAEQSIVKADLTLTFQFPKLSFLFPENAPYIGECKILDINIHPDAIKTVDSDFYLLEKEDVVKLLKKRNLFSHKGNYGHGLLFTGSFGKIGAGILSAKACLRSGIGLLTTHIPECGISAMHTAVPETMLNVDTADHNITEFPDLAPYSAFAAGPGLGTSPQTSAFLENLLSEVGIRPIVLDADALNIISTWPVVDNAFPDNCILTPHPKEFDRLAGDSQTAYERLTKARRFAREHKVFIILKGAYTAITCPDGTCFFNTTGNPGMATGGSGDVLTGMILSFLAQGYSPKNASVLGVYLHGLAGDVAAEKLSEESMIAGDIVNNIGEAFLRLKSEM